MKNLILVCGPNGVGKSSACKALIELLPNSAFIDSDYCRYMNPFRFSEEDIRIVVSNISTLMVNYFTCSTMENVIFQYGFHGPRRQIYARILSVLDQKEIAYRSCPIILTCDQAENIRRMRRDGRDPERIARAIEKTRSLYDEYDYPRIDGTNLSITETASAIRTVLTDEYSI